MIDAWRYIGRGNPVIIVGTASSEWHERGFAIFSDDKVNGFNSITRGAIFRGLRTFFPSLIPVARFYYQSIDADDAEAVDPRLWLPGRVICRRRRRRSGRRAVWWRSPMRSWQQLSEARRRRCWRGLIAAGGSTRRTRKVR